jgi:hypothetical protein
MTDLQLRPSRPSTAAVLTFRRLIANRENSTDQGGHQIGLHSLQFAELLHQVGKEDAAAAAAAAAAADAAGLATLAAQVFESL